MSDDQYEYCERCNYLCTSYSCEPFETCIREGCGGRVYRIEAHYKNKLNTYRIRGGGELNKRRTHDACVWHYREDNTFCGKPTVNTRKYFEFHPLCEAHMPLEDKALRVHGQYCRKCHKVGNTPIRRPAGVNKYRPRWMSKSEYEYDLKRRGMEAAA